MSTDKVAEPCRTKVRRHGSAWLECALPTGHKGDHDPFPSDALMADSSLRERFALLADSSKDDEGVDEGCGIHQQPCHQCFAELSNEVISLRAAIVAAEKHIIRLSPAALSSERASEPARHAGRCTNLAGEPARHDDLIDEVVGEGRFHFEMMEDKPGAAFLQLGDRIFSLFVTGRASLLLRYNEDRPPAPRERASKNSETATDVAWLRRMEFSTLDRTEAEAHQVWFQSFLARLTRPPERADARDAARLNGELFEASKRFLQTWKRYRVDGPEVYNAVEELRLATHAVVTRPAAAEPSDQETPT